MIVSVFYFSAEETINLIARKPNLMRDEFVVLMILASILEMVYT